jgi:hypothetical protein
MKKTYIQPSMKAIKLQLTQFMMASVPVDPSKGTSTQLSRESYFDWDDED